MQNYCDEPTANPQEVNHEPIKYHNMKDLKIHCWQEKARLKSLDLP